MEEINLDSHFDTPSVNFGSGIELLMNDRKKPATNTEHISLEDELKELENFGKIPDSKPLQMNDRKFTFEKKEAPIFLGKETASINTQNQDSGGFKHIDNIQIEEETKKVEHRTKEELLKDKFNYLRKLESIEAKGVTLSRRYSMDSSLDEMKGEYEYILAERERKNSVQFQAKILTTMITGIEFLNNKMDPFDIKLDGWAEQISEDSSSFDDIFEELHEKYKSKAKMAPELKLIFQLATSGMMIHMTNTMFKSAIPGMDDIMRQNPDLMNQFTKAAVNSMENTSPGLGGFMKEFSQKPREREEMRPREEMRAREEMRGPENINSILSGLNKKIDLSNESTISIEEIDSMSNMAGSKKGKRRSDKSISLNI